MLSFANRFHGHGSLRYVYKNGFLCRTKYLSVKVTKNTRRNDTRVAVVVSKKVCKSAVGRNRIRRRVYEIVRHELPNIHGVYDIVIIVVSGEVRVLDTVELYKTIRQSFAQSGLYRITS